MAAPTLTKDLIVNGPDAGLDAVRLEAQRALMQPQYPSSTTILDVAIRTFNTRVPFYRKYQAYYDGDHPLIFTGYEKKNTAFLDLFKKFADNLCRIPVDAVTDRLQVREFTVEAGDAKANADAWALWMANRMAKQALRVHREALRCGDAYVLVWPDDEGNVRLYPQRARQVIVEYDPEKPDVISWAAKWWAERANKRLRINLYFADRIEKYEFKRSSNDLTLPESGKSFTLMEDPMPHDFKRVPVFHFANDSDDGEVGRSELEIVTPLQDALNKAFLDMLIGSEYHALPQRWVTGVEVLKDPATGKPVKPFEPGADKVWTLANEAAKFGQFDAANLEQFLKVKDNIRTEIARVTGLPMHYMNVSSGQQPSGEALRTSEARLVQKVKSRQGDFGDVWEDVMKFALQLDGKGSDAKLETVWVDPQSVSDEEKLNGLVLKQQIGVSTEQLLSEMGYGESDIKRIVKENQAAQDRQQSQFDKGQIGF
ncbi:MAG: phage portal protein [Blastocatellia bacterium]